MATAQVELRTQGQAYLRVLDVWAVAATKAGVRRVDERKLPPELRAAVIRCAATTSNLSELSLGIKL